MNESSSKLKHQGLYPNGATVIVGDSIINGVIEERINKKDRPIKVRNFPGQWQIWNITYSNYPKET